MPLLPIHLLGSPVLREASAPVAEVTEEVCRLVDDMFETMDAAEGVGLAANQIGQALRIAVVDADGYARAAEKLHKSQSAVTYAVQKLERLLDVKAFEIRGRKAVLTPTGQMLYLRARTLLDEAASVERS